MKFLAIAVVLATASPAAAQTAPAHAAHGSSSATQGTVPKAQHPSGCHLMGGKMVRMEAGKAVPCPKKAVKPAAKGHPHAGHDKGHD